jgi:hypothetical protein
MGTEPFPGVKRPGRGADHPPPSSAEVENEFCSPSRPLVACYRVTFTFSHYEYLLGATTVAEAVRGTCYAIWECLKPVYMSIRDSDWIRTADEFYVRADFPNCIGAAEGKHVRMRKPNDNGSQFFSYKNFFSTVLMAVADAVCRFVSAEVGA